MTSETITNRLCEVRTDYGITQKELSSATNISTRTIMRIENGKQVPSLIYAMRLASYFSCNVEQLFGYSQDNETPKKDVKIHE